MTHTLIIHSLHDAHATCSCGNWEFMRTGKADRETVTGNWNSHVEYCDAMELRQAVEQWYSYSLTEQERNALVKPHRGAIEYGITVTFDRLPKTAKDAVTKAYHVDNWPWCEACKSWHHPDNPTCMLARK